MQSYTYISMNASELKIYLEEMTEELLDDASEIIAATATEYYRDSFARKGFDGEAWTPARYPKRKGTLLVDSGALANSIVPSLVSRERVLISAGNSKVDYAQIHNEGFKGLQEVAAHQRKTKGKLVDVKAHSRMVDVPQRQFLGNARELEEMIYARLAAYFNSINNK